MAVKAVCTAVSRMRMKRLSAFLFLLVGSFQAIGQEMPPKPISVYFDQNMSFGAFAPGASGGTVTVTSSGVRLATGSVILVNQGYLYFPAVFQLEGNPGSIVHLLNGPDATLAGSNGGTMTLHLADNSIGDPIILTSAPPARMPIRIGGTLVVGNILTNPPGDYTGYFTIMFIQE